MTWKQQTHCKECQKPLLLIDGYGVCPDGHGRLVPISPIAQSIIAKTAGEIIPGVGIIKLDTEGTP